MPPLEIAPTLLARLMARAEHEHCTVDQVLSRLCDLIPDFTDYQRTQAALYQNEQRLRSLVESQTAYVIRTDMNGCYTYANPRFIEVFGWLTAGENLIGTSCLNSVIAADHPKMLDATMQCIATPGSPIQVVLRKPAYNGGVLSTLWEFMAIVDSDSIVREIQCIGFDITQQVETEQIRLEHQHMTTLLQKEREYTTLIQKTISALAHDVRIPLTVIGSAKEMLERYYERMDEEKRREKLDSIGKQLRYVVEMLDDMAITVKGSLSQIVFTPTPVKITTLCQLTVNELQATTGNRHHLRFSNQTSLNLVLIDETLVSRILLNLLSNAIKFSPEGSQILLELQQRETWLVLSIIDQGMGISPEDQAHIFEPFFRTESANAIPGTGLGLNIVKDCVDHHQGKIYIESEIGKGTTFIVEIPLVLPS